DAYYEAAFPNLPTWETGYVTGLFAAADVEDIEAQVRRRVGIDSPAQVDSLADSDWERAWLSHYRPVEISEDLCICPSWLQPPNPQATVVYLDPGLAFGTGTHVTTRLCLEEFCRFDWRGKYLVDYGCGSGILAIAALKLGARRAAGLDLDPHALRASTENARRNGVLDRYQAAHPKEFKSAPAEVLVANILADVIVDLAYTLTNLVAIQGRILLTGILTSQVEDVIAAFAPRCAFEVIDREDWSLLKGHRNR
ncbi:MAG: 50S ribosomal protein L11 methyltransferase, partial [Gammaproteobacteria bacterium]|nr:50S ribosomal protein L11 methyltransferase [Gammaproteobacteria bacterium]